MDVDGSPNIGNIPPNSFKKDLMTKMTYENFIKTMSDKTISITLKD